MSSVSPRSSVSEMAKGESVGLGMPLTPSQIFGENDLKSMDSGVKLQVLEAYYRALTAYNAAVVRLELGDEQVEVQNQLAAGSSVSATSSSASRRRRVRRALMKKSFEQLSVDECSVELSYLALVRPEYKLAARRGLGMGPVVDDLLASPEQWFISDGELVAYFCLAGRSPQFVYGQGEVNAIEYFREYSDAGYRVDQLGGRWAFDVESASGFLDELGSLCETELRSDGFCYLDFVRAGSEAFVRSGGPNIALTALLSMPSTWFDLSKVDLMVSYYPTVRLVHVDPDGPYRFSDLAYTMISRSSIGYDPTQFGYYCSRVGEHQRLSLGSLTGVRVGALSAAAAELLQLLVRYTGLSVDSFSADSLELVTKSAAMLDTSARAKLRLYEAVGDNLFSNAIAVRCLREQLVVSQYQDARSLLTSNSRLGDFFAASEMRACVSFVGGVSPVGRVGAAALEAIVAVVYTAGGSDAVEKFCAATDFYSDFPLWK